MLPCIMILRYDVSCHITFELTAITNLRETSVKRSSLNVQSGVIESDYFILVAHIIFDCGIPMTSHSIDTHDNYISP